MTRTHPPLTPDDLQDRDVVIVSAVRSPIGAIRGALSTVRPDDLAATVIKEAVNRAGVPAEQIEEVILGCANQAGEDNRNVARMAALLAGLPETVAGLTVNRLCASGLAAINTAARAIRNGDGDVYVAGGVESMTRAPLTMPKGGQAFANGNVTVYDTTLGWRFPNPAMEALFPLEAMGETAENIVERSRQGEIAGGEITREAQDAFALESQRRAVAALNAGTFREEIVPIEVKGRKGVTVFDTDEHPRYKREGDSFTLATDEATLAGLKPAFRKGGSVTAGNASGLNDGAAALVLMSAKKARELGLKPLARWVGAASAGVDPRVMGLGPVPATRKLMERLELDLSDVDLVELNEAFAAQALACIRELELDPEKVNVNGGAVALGHPLGMSGARLVTTLTHELERRGARYGLATLCVGVGQGEAALIERVEA
ncbi:thiolase family protein [Deinococcus metallilatus]|uniref:acetyl-CoA C-acyltransferase n=1 Tax=Deinococcus metallilatus TaxID=1211322 RepID=A0AAJ5F3B1_9DEIO|nr:thiolase family protein [Deinococcus metallilatus]MBB5294199.1 acetyl-CoA C-acetyltransferase [Deinococcus metallilatus]QBY08978.1 thiolase family protein [Deinococcus metallilatus]RXJ10122.1 thiolase family protein [Deinococcus metallilatus]TLK27941.1 thiolase family protein [Deinococcus metallilatus]GMA16464.1 acetyl-CoA acetyltransferase [Deinococcus metallilatus]